MVRNLLKSSRMLIDSWARKSPPAWNPKIELIFDEANVFKRDVLLIHCQVGSTIICLPVQVLQELPDPAGAAKQEMELCKQSTTSSAKLVRSNALVPSKTASSKLYKALSNSLARMAGFSFSFTIPASPLKPVREGEERVRSSTNGRCFIVDGQGELGRVATQFVFTSVQRSCVSSQLEGSQN